MEKALRPDPVVEPFTISIPPEVLDPPRSWVERGYNVVRWTEMPRGGHFAAMEAPELLAGDVTDFLARS